MNDDASDPSLRPGSPTMSDAVAPDVVQITIGADTFTARWEIDISPHTCAAFRRLLPYAQKIIHARWSGEACWIPLGTFDLDVGPENPISQPKPAQILFYPAGVS